jgi:hypothetical protein
MSYVSPGGSRSRLGYVGEFDTVIETGVWPNALSSAARKRDPRPSFPGTLLLRVS